MFQPADRRVRDVGEYVSQPSLRIDVVELRRANDAQHEGGALTDARRNRAIWRYDYNNVLPHSSLGCAGAGAIVFNRKTLVMIEGLTGRRSLFMA